MTDRVDELEIEMNWKGRDEFSNLKLPALKQRLPKESDQVAAMLTDPAEQAAALRWILRGYRVESAVERVELRRVRAELIREKKREKKKQQDIIG